MLALWIPPKNHNESKRKPETWLTIQKPSCGRLAKLPHNHVLVLTLTAEFCNPLGLSFF